MNRGSVVARWRRCWAWALALVCLSPAAARADLLWSLADAGEIDEALKRVKLERLRTGARADAATLEALREQSAFVVQRSHWCPVQVQVINLSGHAMWHVRVAASGRTGGKLVEREMHLSFVPARSKATVEFRCSLWSAEGAPIVVNAPPTAPGHALGPDVVREMLAAKADQFTLYGSFFVKDYRSTESAAAVTLQVLLGEQDRGPLRAFARQLILEPAGAELLATTLFRGDQSYLDVDRVIAAARDGKVDVIAAMEVDQVLRAGCVSTGSALEACALLVKERLGDGAGDLIAARFFQDIDAALRWDLSSKSVSSAQAHVRAVRELRDIGLKTGPIVQDLCDQASTRPGSAEDLLALAEQIEPGAPCVAPATSILFWAGGKSRATDAGKLFAILLPVLLVALYFRHKIRRLRVKLELDSEEPSARRPAPGRVSGLRLDAEAWARSFEGGVTDLCRGLDADGSEPCRAASEAIGRAMAGNGAAIAKVARRCAADALRRGALRSVLARLDGLLLYVLVVPSAHVEPKALVRYAPLTDGWTGHARRLVEGSPALAGAKRSVVSLILFVRPGASEVTLVAGYDDGQRRVWPGPLLAAGEARRVEGRVYPDHHEFNLEPA